MRTCVTAGLLVWVVGCGDPDVDREAAQPPGTDSAQIQSWLVSGGHRGWASESGPIPTSQFGAARTFFSPALAQSVEARAAVHPVGATAVREFYAEDFTTLTGFAYITRATDEPGPEGWFWFESYDLTSDGDPQAAGFAAPTCVGCHVEGTDFVQTPWPLR